MPFDSRHELTALLQDWSEGDKTAFEKLAPLVYSELKRLARKHMAKERSPHTLESGALVNEAFLRLVDWKSGLPRVS
jgi:RNA polymerase sigma-70 factor, ECF subfamily